MTLIELNIFLKTLLIPDPALSDVLDNPRVFGSATTVEGVAVMVRVNRPKASRDLVTGLSVVGGVTVSVSVLRETSFRLLAGSATSALEVRINLPRSSLARNDGLAVTVSATGWVISCSAPALSWLVLSLRMRLEALGVATSSSSLFFPLLTAPATALAPLNATPPTFDTMPAALPKGVAISLSA